MSVFQKIHDTLRTIVKLGVCPIIGYGKAPEPDGMDFRAFKATNKTANFEGFDAAVTQFTFKDAEDNKLFGDHKADVDVERWVAIASSRHLLDTREWLKTIGRTIPADKTLGTPRLLLTLTLADVELSPVNSPSSGTYVRMELEITAAPVASG